jgi:hypothetical protein
MNMLLPVGEFTRQLTCSLMGHMRLVVWLLISVLLVLVERNATAAEERSFRLEIHRFLRVS